MMIIPQQADGREIMHHFEYREGELSCEGVSLARIAEEVGTPYYCYSTATFLQHLEAYKKAFSGVDSIICYSVKCNGNLAVLNTLSKAGAGADIVSGGELFRAVKAGVDPKKIVY